jgi:hypothetical protein
VLPPPISSHLISFSAYVNTPASAVQAIFPAAATKPSSNDQLIQDSSLNEGREREREKKKGKPKDRSRSREEGQIESIVQRERERERERETDAK